MLILNTKRICIVLKFSKEQRVDSNMYKNRIGKHLSFRTIIIGGIIVVLIVFLVTGISVKRANKEKGNLITSSTLTEAIDISGLSAAQFTYNGIAEIYKDESKEKVESYIRYNAKIKAGIDMKEVKWKIDKEEKQVKATLPEIIIIVNTVDEKSLSFIPEDSEVELKRALIACKEDAEREAKESGALKETAEENAKSIIEGLLYPILESQKYKLVWE